MQSINHVMIMGNLGADPEAQVSSSGKTWCRFRIATNYRTKSPEGDKEATTWHQIKVFGKTAEACQTYLRKGSLAIVDGYIQNSTFKKKDGTDGFKSEVVAQQVTFLNSPRGLLPERPVKNVAMAETVPF